MTANVVFRRVVNAIAGPLTRTRRQHEKESQEIDTFVKMLAGLREDEEYRKNADALDRLYYDGHVE